MYFSIFPYFNENSKMFARQIMQGKSLQKKKKEIFTFQVCVFTSSMFILLMLLSVNLGLIPQLIGVAPEKAIKLTVSFFFIEFMSFCLDYH